MDEKIDFIGPFIGKNEIFSNFYPFETTLDGVEYPTIENAYQAAQTGDLEQRQQFETCSPGKAKRLGKRLTPRDDWDKVKLQIMYDLCRQKLTAEGFREPLLATGAAQLVELNDWGDTYWGVCHGVGKNHLGRVLMRIREELGAQQSDEDATATGSVVDTAQQAPV